jgi:hypothetical protein
MNSKGFAKPQRPPFPALFTPGPSRGGGREPPVREGEAKIGLNRALLGRGVALSHGTIRATNPHPAWGFPPQTLTGFFPQPSLGRGCMV